MAFILSQGESITVQLPKKASTAMSQGAVLDASGGFMQPATAASTSLIGVLQYPIASTDSDYASATQVPLLTLTDKTVWEADVFDTTLIAATLIGTFVDLKNSTQLDLSATAHKQFLVTAINSAKGTVSGHFNGSALYENAV